MTKDKTVTMSRELAESLLTEATNQNWSDLNILLKAPSDSIECRCRRFGKNNPHWPCPVHLIADPVVERQEPVTLPARLFVGDIRNPYRNTVLHDGYISGWNAYQDAMVKLGPLYTAPPELAELQAIISRLTADVETMRAKNNELNDTVERLKGGQGEAVAWFTEDHLTDKSATTYDVGVSVMWGVKGWPVTPLYTSQPAPVAVDDSTTSDKYRAELYDEVWQKARDMGFANVTDALERLDDIDGCPRLDKVKELNQ